MQDPPSSFPLLELPPAGSGEEAHELQLPKPGGGHRRARFLPGALPDEEAQAILDEATRVLESPTRRGNVESGPSSLQLQRCGEYLQPSLEGLLKPLVQRRSLSAFGGVDGAVVWQCQAEGALDYWAQQAARQLRVSTCGLCARVRGRAPDVPLTTEEQRHRGAAVLQHGLHTVETAERLLARRPGRPDRSAKDNAEQVADCVTDPHSYATAWIRLDDRPAGPDGASRLKAPNTLAVSRRCRDDSRH
eukprot:s66_g1.t1